ncbi:hypothetical protein [Methylobacterium radiotolerans]|uniref:hypothetical protein n=1 Tax=Methylobacterium radiotolerans TaxID=31998 RepID=UPI0038CF6BAA
MRYDVVHTKRGSLQLSVPNTGFAGDGFYVSYNDHDVHIYGSDTTALVFGQMQRFFLLNGDHRRQYMDLMPQGFAACMDYYKANPDLQNSRSDMTDDPILGLDQPLEEPALAFRP